MLSQSDIEWIRSNRAEVTEGRTELVDLIREVSGEADPYTGEVSTTETRETISVVWKDMVFRGRYAESQIVNGVLVENDDVFITFDSGIDLRGVIRIDKNDDKYVIITQSKLGIGTINRQECIARRTT